MEDGLRGWQKKKMTMYLLNGLNPCFNGRWSARCSWCADEQSQRPVLILVLMEDGLRELVNLL